MLGCEVIYDLISDLILSFGLSNLLIVDGIHYQRRPSVDLSIHR